MPPLIISRPFFLAMTDRRVTRAQSGVTLPLIPVRGRATGGELFHVAVHEAFIGALSHAQATLAAREDHSQSLPQAPILYMSPIDSLVD